MQRANVRPNRLGPYVVALLLSPWSHSVYADERALPKAEPDDSKTVLSDIVVKGRGEDLLGVAGSATQGTVGPEELKARPLARPGEVLETVPGMIITQHTGGGKANQYYLRGFNLDHGTDFATYLDDVPLNLPTHAHGPGYTDLNWLIPELVAAVHFEKGPYYPEYGDFANVGAARIEYAAELPEDFVKVESGTLGYERALFAGSPKIGTGHLLYAFEGAHNDGAWQLKNDYRRTNALVKWSDGNDASGYSVAAQAYQGLWLGSDQIPERAVEAGLDRYASLDPDTGGQTHRYSTYGEWHRRSDDAATKINFYLVRYDLDLYSDFTYGLDQTYGDQIEQKDQRFISGIDARHTIYGKLLGNDTENTAGLQVRHDQIGLGLNRTDERVVIAPVRFDQVSQTNTALWLENKTSWTSWFRTEGGARADLFDFDDVSTLNGVNSGTKSAGAVSPKLSLILGPWAKSELYAQGGLGIRSNDARGIVEKRTPDGVGAARPLEPIARSRGGEIGLRTSAVPGLSSTLSYWTLLTNSEIYFDGDAGASVDTGRPSRRIGVEWNNFYKLQHWLFVDADFAVSKAQFTDSDPVGNNVPEAVAKMVSAGLSVADLARLPSFGASLRVRYIGPRDLIEDGSERSSPSTVLNGQVSYLIWENLAANVEVLNLANTRYDDNEYYYESRLKGEPRGPGANGGYNDHMVHAGEPRSVRVGLTATY